MKHDEAQLSERITFAEDWLARARRQLEQGETARGNLTLLLAEAEVHRARELGMSGERGRPALSPGRVAVGILTVAALAAAMWANGLQPAATPQPADSSSAVIVTLSEGRGSLLELVRAPAVADAKTDDRGRPARAKAAQAQVRTVVGRPLPSALEPVVVASPPPLKPEPVPSAAAAPPAPPSPPATADTPAPAVAQPSAPPVVSEANLIDLVLATERSLRRANQ